MFFFAAFSFFVSMPCLGQPGGLQVQDIFGRNLNQVGLTLVDWDGYMANPAIKFFLIPPSGAKFPATAILSANDQRLYFDLPSTVGPNGPTKTITFANATSKVPVYLGNAPDRETTDGYYTLTIAFTAADNQTESLQLPIHKIDQDEESAGPYTINIDFSKDQTNFFSDGSQRAVIQQELADWSYFVDDMKLDAVPVGTETTFIWNPDGFVSGYDVTNAFSYAGYLLYVYGIHSSALRSGGGVSAAGGFQSSGGVPLPLKRSGGVEIETQGNYNTLGWLLGTSDLDWWVSGNLGSEQNELFSISHHESGHAIAFNPTQPNWAKFKDEGCVNDPAVIAYHGTCPVINSSDHLGGEIDNDSLVGAFGNEYNGLIPARRWFITKLDLLVLQAIGYKLRNTSAVVRLTITSSTIASALLQQPYSAGLAAHGGIPFYNWSIVAGALPDGLTLDTFSGVISGIPTKVGTFAFTAAVQEYREGSPLVTKQFRLTVNPAPASPIPTFSATSVVNSATFSTGSVAPGELVTIFGKNLGPTAARGAQLEDGALTTEIGGVQVLFDGVPSPMILASSGQVNAIVPYEIQGNSGTTLQIEYSGVSSSPVALTVAQANPGIFTANSSGRGQGAILNQDFSYNSLANPAAVGSVVLVYLSGAGQMNPLGVDGEVPSDQLSLTKPVLPVSAAIGGVTAPVEYAGEAVGIVSGVIQVNLLVPTGVRSGQQPVTVQFGSFTTQSGVTVSVK